MGNDLSVYADSFGRLRVSNPEVIFESTLQYDIQPFLWETSKSAKGSTTHLPNESSCSIAHSDGTINEFCIRQTKEYFRYTPGKSLLIMNSVCFGTTQGGCAKRVGYFDASNGVYLENLSGQLGIVKRTKISGSVVNTRIEYKDWNGMAKNYIGTKTLDPTKDIIFFISVQWLGVGSVQCGFIVDGKPIIAHTFHHANILSTSYMTTANLPCRYELTNVAASVADSFRQIGTCVISEGGVQIPNAYACSASNGVTGISVSTRRPVLSIAPSLTFNSIANRSKIIPYSVDIVAVTQNVLIEVVYAPTAIANSSFGAIDANYSAVSKDVAGDGITGGYVIKTFPVFTTGQGATSLGFGGQNILSRLPLTLNIAGDTATALSIVATAFTSTATVYATVNFMEIR